MHGNYILLDIYNQVENMNLQTSKFWITLKKDRLLNDAISIQFL